MHQFWLIQLVCSFVFVFSFSPFGLAQQSSGDPSTDRDKKHGRQTAESLNVTDRDGQPMEMHYWLFLPKASKDTSDANKKWPLLVFLHGRGECGDDLELVKKWGPPKIVEAKPEFPFIVVSPQCPTPKGSVRMGWDTTALKQLVNDVVANRNVDESRIYLTGLSMGGYGSWRMAAQFPDLFSAVIPICGGGDPTSAGSLKEIPIWVFHGEKDRVVPISASQKMVDAIKEAGGSKVRMTVYPDAGHNSWSKTYANDDIYEWLLKHSRNKQR